MTTNLRVLPAVVASLLLCSCSGEFDELKVKYLLEGQPVPLEGEQVSLTQMQVDCGVGAELWNSPSEVSKERFVSRLNAPARSLNFSDDVSVTETGYRLPYAQVRGSFMLQVSEVSSIRDSGEQGVKVAAVKAGIKVNHPCLTSPLPLMGVKRGSFSADVPASFEFSLRNDGWHVDRMIH
jgi:hypothetical protein